MRVGACYPQQVEGCPHSWGPRSSPSRASGISMMSLPATPTLPAKSSLQKAFREGKFVVWWLRLPRKSSPSLRQSGM